MKEYGLLQTLVLILSFYFWGPIYGIVLIAILVWVVDLVLDIFGYQRVVLGDLFCSIEPTNANHSGCTIYIMERLKFEEFKEQMIKRALMKIRRFSQVMVTRFGIKLWKDVDPRSQVDNIIKSNVKWNSIENLKDYANKLAEEFKLEESKPMWNYVFIEDYQEDKSAVMHVSHHSITDGIGFWSFMTTIDDEPFTHTINKTSCIISINSNIIC